MMKGLLGLRVPIVLYNSSCRTLSMAAKVDKSLLSQLRKMTGFSFVNCKKALERFDNDLQQAEQWLKEQAQKEGWAKATKLQHRSMSQGLIAIIEKNQAATMIEVNCETDFVARNNKFIDLTTHLAQECHQSFLQLPSASVSVDKSVLGGMLSSSGQKLSDLVALEVANIGENMALRRAVHFKNEGGNSAIASYVHASGLEIVASASCRLGKYGVLILLEQKVRMPSPEKEYFPLHHVGHLLGQHIVGMSPRTIGLLDVEDLKNDDRPVEEQEDEDRLVHQAFLLDPNVKVGQLLDHHGVTVHTFSRFACGEELPEDNQ